MERVSAAWPLGISERAFWELSRMYAGISTSPPVRKRTAAAAKSLQLFSNTMWWVVLGG